MAGNAVTTDAEGDVLQFTYTQPVATISFGAKNGLPNYSNEECSLFLQVPIDVTQNETIDLTELEQTLDPYTQFVKAFVYKQVGVQYDVDGGTVVRTGTPVQTAAPKKATGARKAPAKKAAKRSGGGSDFNAKLEDAWKALSGASDNGKGGWTTEDGDLVFDNRDDKASGERNAKSPDFKFGDKGEYAGIALWADSAPEWFVEPGFGEVIG